MPYGESSNVDEPIGWEGEAPAEPEYYEPAIR